ncbi:MAG: TMEM165/GDT1 family protein [Thermoplasmata archaeon]|nr:TMEM165/GDT1 family protein [Thermoplasmata archaeon]
MKAGALGANLFVEGILIFAVVAILQLPGKSNFGVITLAARHPYRDVVFGASVGLGAATVVSVTIGYGAETVLGPFLLWVKVAGGLVLIAFGLREILRVPGPIHEPGEGTPAVAHTARQVRTVALGLVFLLEMGDNTQILSILFVASTHNILLVFVAATAALVMITVLSARGARYLQAHVPEERLRVLLGGLLIAVGLLTIVFTVVPSLLPFTG